MLSPVEVIFILSTQRLFKHPAAPLSAEGFYHFCLRSKLIFPSSPELISKLKCQSRLQLFTPQRTENSPHFSALRLEKLHMLLGWTRLIQEFSLACFCRRNLFAQSGKWSVRFDKITPPTKNGTQKTVKLNEKRAKAFAWCKSLSPNYSEGAAFWLSLNCQQI